MGSIPHWEHIQFNIALKLNRAVPYIGPFIISSSFRTSGGGYHPQGRAFDIQPESPAWTVFQKLKALGFKRIGIQPLKNMLHVDDGAGEYYFLENSNGEDIGPLHAQPVQNLAVIPGYTSGQAVIIERPGNEFLIALIPLAFIIGKNLYTNWRQTA